MQHNPMMTFGTEREEILKYCLGDNWETFSISDSREIINEKLGLNIQVHDDFDDSIRLMVETWRIFKRNSKIEDILK